MSVGPATGSAGLARIDGERPEPGAEARGEDERAGRSRAWRHVARRTRYASSNSMSVSGRPCARRCSMKSDR